MVKVRLQGTTCEIKRMKKAAELVNTIRPNVAIPVHYGSIVGKSSDCDVFAQNVKDPIKVEFKIMF